MSTPAPPPSNLGQQFTRRPKVYVDQVDKGKVLVTGPSSEHHPDGWSGYASRQGGSWRAEDEFSEKSARAKNARHVGEVLAHMHGHEPGSFDVEYTKEAY